MINPHDTTYLDLVYAVLTHGEMREDRTGTCTLSLFGTRSIYDLTQGFPLLTTKRMHWRSIVLELLWFLRGETNTKTLGCGIWDAWAEEDGNVPHCYGAQWRRWGGDVDQIRNVIQSLRTDPESRRHLVTAWNPSLVPQSGLPPCHAMFQFYVRAGGYLDCQLYQRSGDLGLGVPFNIASYALLTHIVAKDVGLTPGVFTHVIGDAHVYFNHIRALEEQLFRKPFAPPSISIADRPWDQLEYKDIALREYDCHPGLKMEVSV